MGPLDSIRGARQVLAELARLIGQASPRDAGRIERIDDLLEDLTLAVILNPAAFGQFCIPRETPEASEN